MSPQTIKMIVAAFSMKKEIKYICYSVIILCMMPIFAVITLTQAGINIVSNVLATINPQTQQVEIHDPSTGNVIDTITEPRTWPISGNVTLEFAQPSPFQLSHTGIDIASPTKAVGDPVGAFMKGTVIYADETVTGFGKHVKIDHGHNIVSIYAHLDTIEVKVGQELGIGEIVGTRGDTGWSTGPHLHFQINVFGIPVNPRVFLSGNP